jgi:hypothetical protein
MVSNIFLKTNNTHTVLIIFVSSVFNHFAIVTTQNYITIFSALCVAVCFPLPNIKYSTNFKTSLDIFAGKKRSMNRNCQGTARRGRNRRPAHTRNFTCRVLLSKLSEETVQEINNRKYCQLCHHSQSDPLRCGKLYSIGQVTVHYYCLVSAFTKI